MVFKLKEVMCSREEYVKKNWASGPYHCNLSNKMKCVLGYEEADSGI